MCGLENDIYFQIGLVMLMGLAAKNAILIVEFAKEMVDKGEDVVQAAVMATRQRFRPILMTSFAFILGVLPLVTATGAGAESRVSLGLSVFAGMLMSTLVGTFFIPNFYQFWQKIQEKFFEKKK
jgi:multidrug efflux pump subunit AcrB